MSFRITSRHEGKQIVLRLAPPVGTDGQIEVGRIDWTIVAAAGPDAWVEFLKAATRGMADALTGKNTGEPTVLQDYDLN